MAEDPMPNAPAPEGTPPAGPGPLTDDDKLYGMLAHVTGGLTSFVGPLVIYLIKQEESKFIAFHSLQSLYFQLLVLAVHTVLSVTCVGAVLIPFVWVGSLIYAIVLGIKVKNGEDPEYFLAGKWARPKQPAA